MTGSAPATNLSPALTSFIGRTNEIAEVRRLLAGTRLLTLTGAGGCGKTRLALEAAGGLLLEYPDGVWLIELAAIGDAGTVPEAAASSLGIQERPGESVADALVAALKSKTLLLALDNCEHLASACGALAETLLRGCPRLRLLATSRAPLGVPGETQWRVPSLSLPDPAVPPSPDRLEEFEAIQLFRERAKASLPSFQITGRNGPAVLNVCTRLDGMPLAIELAAARVRVLAVEEIAARLDARLLTGPTPTTVPRHQSLRAVTDWSYGLLSEREQALFRRLAVFTGGWGLAAAEAVCSIGDMPPGDVRDLLIQLVEKSLVTADTRGSEARYRLLETVRQYGLERLTESGEGHQARRRHRDWYLALAERGEPHLYGRDQPAWLDRLELEHDNLRAALEFCRSEPAGAEPQLRLAGALHRFWVLHNHWSEGRRRLEDALTRSAEAPRSALPKVLLGATFFACRQGDTRRAIAVGETGLAVCLEQGDQRSRARLLTWLAQAAMREGDWTRAASLADQSLALSRELEDPHLISLALSTCGTVARNRGDHARALANYEEGLIHARRTEDRYRIAYALCNVGHAALRRRNYERAESAYQESLMTAGHRGVAEECFVGLATVACARKDYDRGARLLGAVDALRDALGNRLFPTDQAEYDRHAAATRKRLGAIRFAAAVANGRAMTFGDAVTYALAPRVIKSRRGTGAGRSGAGPGKLTPRELDVASLVADGLTNPEIASRLGISPRTVGVHVEHILSKLAAKSRSQIAAWAAEHG